jgi:hypothetical protein
MADGSGEGFEDSANSPRFLGAALSRNAESDALFGDSASQDPRLVALVAAWPMIPEPVKQRVVAIVQAAGRALRLRNEIRDFLQETCGLELSAEKTRITHVRDGYNFLAFHICVEAGKSGKYVPKVKVGRKALANIQLRLGEALRYRPLQEGLSIRLARSSTVIRGWANYFKRAHDFLKVAHRLDYQAFWLAVKTICRKEDISTATCLWKYKRQNTLQVTDGCTLARFCDTPLSLECRAPEPYQPGTAQINEADAELEADCCFYEGERPGSKSNERESCQRLAVTPDFAAETT